MVIAPLSLIFSRVGRISWPAAGAAVARSATIARTDLIDMVTVPRRWWRLVPRRWGRLRVPGRGSQTVLAVAMRPSSHGWAPRRSATLLGMMSMGLLPRSVFVAAVLFGWLTSGALGAPATDPLPSWNDGKTKLAILGF